MPDPSLDEDARFQVALVQPDDPSDPNVYVAIKGPSGFGCFYCGGPYDGLIAVPATPKGKPVRIACCLEHKTFGIAWIEAKLNAGL